MLANGLWLSRGLFSGLLKSRVTPFANPLLSVPCPVSLPLARFERKPHDINQGQILRAEIG